MPFESKAQQGYLHAHPEILGEKKLKEFDEATRGMHLPEHAHKTASYSIARKARKE